MPQSRGQQLEAEAKILASRPVWPRGFNTRLGVLVLVGTSQCFMFAVLVSVLVLVWLPISLSHDLGCSWSLF